MGGVLRQARSAGRVEDAGGAEQGARGRADVVGGAGVVGAVALDGGNVYVGRGTYCRGNRVNCFWFLCWEIIKDFVRGSVCRDGVGVNLCYSGGGGCCRYTNDYDGAGHITFASCSRDGGGFWLRGLRAFCLNLNTPVLLS